MFKFTMPVLPLNLAYLAAMLGKEGIRVRVIDQYACKMSNSEVLKIIYAEEPEIVGFSCLTPVVTNVARLVKEIRKHLKDCKIILGNIHPSIFATEMLEKGLADIVVRGEGEESLRESIFNLRNKNSLINIAGISFKDGSKVCHNLDRLPIDNLETLPYPAWHLFEFKYYMRTPLINSYRVTLPIQASRGCDYQCTFCGQDKIYKKPRYRKNESIILEMEYFYEKFGVSDYGFTDAYFPFSVSQGLEFCELLIKKNLHKKIKWITESRVDKVNFALLKKMKEAGCNLIMYGFETGDERILSQINKKITLLQMKETMEWTKKIKIQTLGFFILGLPGENIDTCKKTVQLAKELDCDIVKFNLAIPFPGSKLFNTHQYGEDYFHDSEKFFSWYNWLGGDKNPPYVPKSMTAEELVDVQKMAMCSYYLRPKVIVRMLAKRIFSFKDILYGGYYLLRHWIYAMKRQCLRN